MIKRIKARTKNVIRVPNVGIEKKDAKKVPKILPTVDTAYTFPATLPSLSFSLSSFMT